MIFRQLEAVMHQCWHISNTKSTVFEQLQNTHSIERKMLECYIYISKHFKSAQLVLKLARLLFMRLNWSRTVNLRRK